MDMFKHELAPIGEQGWTEIKERTKEVLLSRLTARKVVRVSGPMGLDYTGVNEGRLKILDEKSSVRTGLYRIKPLVETRTRFTLNRWELDNLARGAKDVDFSPLEKAIEDLALFEEQAVYQGYEQGSITGLVQSTGHKVLPFGKEGNEILDAVTTGIDILVQSFFKGPYALVVGEPAWLALNKENRGSLLLDTVKRIVGGPVLFAPTVKGAILIPQDNENLELTIGNDFSLGYESHDSKEVTLFATESFTFRVLDPTAIISYK